MDALEKGLTELLAADAPPARDGAFAHGVMARIEQARFRDELVRNGAIAAAAALLLFAFAPQLAGLMQSFNGNLVALVAVTLGALWAMQWLLQQTEA